MVSSNEYSSLKYTNIDITNFNMNTNENIVYKKISINNNCAKYFTIAPVTITANIIDIHIINIVRFSFAGSLSTIIM